MNNTLISISQMQKNNTINSIFTRPNLYLFGIGLFSHFFVRIIGSITIGEILFLFLFLFLLLKGDVYHCHKNKELKIYTNLLLLATFGCILSSLFSYVDLVNTCKGLFTILLLIPGLYVFFWLLFPNPNRIVCYLIGTIISSVLVNNLFPQFSDLVVNQRRMTKEEIDETLFFMKYVPYFSLCIILFYKRFPRLTAISMVIMGFICLFGSSRANFLIYLISSAILILIGGKTNPAIIMTKIRKHKVYFFAIIVVAGWGISQGYTYLASSGTLGEKAQRKYEIQSSGNLGNLGGRNMFFRGLIAVIHHPIIGVGDTKNANIDDAQEIIKEYVSFVGADYDDYNTKNVSGHSSILDWWLSFGILALPFWLYLLAQSYTCLTQYFFACRPLSAYVLVGNFTLLWNVFFSPFGNRLDWAIMIALMISLKYYSNNIVTVNSEKL